MCGMVDHYLGVFARLETGILPDSRPEAINFRSPGKPLLLMAVLDLIARHRLNRNFIEITDELSGRFAGYLGRLPTEIGSVRLAGPFIGLQSENFWHLRPRAVHGPADPKTITTVAQLREYYFGAKFSDDLFPLLQMQTSREKLRTALLETYFSVELQKRLRDFSKELV
jgi:putative restriction endonuclease